MEKTNQTTLNQYVIMKTLGQGAFSKVKLAQDTNTNQYVAVKIHKADGKFTQTMADVVQTEALAIKSLNNQGIVNMIEFIPHATVKKANGTEYPVICVIVEELAQGGELFFYVKNSGYFKEQFARHFFHQIIDAIEYVHKAGYAHRDIKPDNILLDDQFNVKIADFGFAGPIAGRTGTGFLTTKLGTVPYQAPEINEKRPYHGDQVDLFAVSIVLFITVAGTPPFSVAEKNEFYYKLLVNKKWEMFWKYHSKGKPTGSAFFSLDFQDLVQKMFSYDPNERLTIPQIKAHPWFNGPLPTQEEVLTEFNERKQVNDEEAERERAEKQQQKARKRNVYESRTRAVKGINSDEEEEEEEEELEKFELSRPIRTYEKIPGVKANIMMMQENPDTIIEAIEDHLLTLAENEEAKYTVSESDYKAKVEFETTGLKFALEILKYNDKNMFVIDFTKKAGNIVDFYNQVEEIKKGLNHRFGYEEETQDNE